MTAVRVHAIGPDDWELWRDVRLRALADAPEAFNATLGYWQQAKEQRWRGRLTDVPYNVIATASAGPVGQASGTTTEVEGRIEVISLWVDPEHRRSGAATALVEDVTAWAAREHEAHTICLAVKRDNVAARTLYRRLGFTETDEPCNPGEVVMTRAVPSA